MRPLYDLYVITVAVVVVVVVVIVFVLCCSLLCVVGTFAGSFQCILALLLVSRCGHVCSQWLPENDRSNAFCPSKFAESFHYASFICWVPASGDLRGGSKVAKMFRTNI